MPSKVLMIALEYPPCQSAGVQRTLKFTEQLPQFGWEPLVLTANNRSYLKLDESQDVPQNIEVQRAFGLDVSRHLAIKGKYFGGLSVPDRYSSWVIGAVVKGLAMIKRHKPRVIWSTYPVPSAHLIAFILSKMTQTPWVADYRDPAPFHYFPGDYGRVHRWVDRKVIENANKVVFATEPMKMLYQSQYSELSNDRVAVIENGFNEAVFEPLLEKLQSDQVPERTHLKGNQLQLLHSGALYPNGRNPEPLFKALAHYHDAKTDDMPSIKVSFRGSQSTPEYDSLVSKLKIEDFVEFLPPIPYEASIQEMTQADALLLIQGGVFHYQIPGKAYEYIASRKPVLALTSEGGASATLFAGVEQALFADSDSESAISKALEQLHTLTIREGDVAQYGRLCRSKSLAELLDAL